jgi:hypothetical protein
MTASAFGLGSQTFYPQAPWGLSPITPGTGHAFGGYPTAQPYSSFPTVPFGGHGLANTPAWGQSPQHVPQWLHIVPPQLQQLQQLAQVEQQQLQQILHVLPLHIQQLQQLVQLLPHIAREVQQLLVAQSPHGVGPMGFVGPYGPHPIAPQAFGPTGYVM